MRVLLFLVFILALDSPLAGDVVTGGEVAVSPGAGDEVIAERLTRIFGEIDDLSEIEVKVSNGVVTLSGTVGSSEARKEAMDLTAKTSGVVYVQDQIDDTVEVGARLAPATQKAYDLGRGFLRKLPLIVIALLSVILAWMVGAWLERRRFWSGKFGFNELSSSLFGRALKLGLIALGIFVALEILDATSIAAGVLGVAGVAGITLGFAFRNIVENYLAGILLSMRNPFSTGDAVEVGDHTGKVVRLTSRDTVLMTYDGNHLRIPNSVIITSALTNFSRNPLRRFEFSVGVSTDLDLVKVRELGLDTLVAIPAVLDDPAPQIVIEALGDSTVNLRFYAWMDQRENDFLKTKSESIRQMKDAFDEAGIEMPEPIYRVHLHQAGELKESPQKVSHEVEEEAQDLTVDDTIDRQVAKSQKVDQETNLLAE